MWVRSLGQEDPLEKEMATHSSHVQLDMTDMPPTGQACYHLFLGHAVCVFSATIVNVSLTGCCAARE